MLKGGQGIWSKKAIKIFYIQIQSPYDEYSHNIYLNCASKLGMSQILQQTDSFHKNMYIFQMISGHIIYQSTKVINIQKNIKEMELFSICDLKIYPSEEHSSAT